MKSKTSSFNTTIFKKNLTHYWPIWIVYLCYLIVVVPLSIWLYANNESNYIGNVPLTQKQYYVIGSALAGAGIGNTGFYCSGSGSTCSVFLFI